MSVKSKKQIKVSRRNEKVYAKRLREGLTVQDIKIIRSICREKTSQEIANELGMSKRTIDNSRLMIIKILGCKNNVGVVKYAIKELIFEL